MSGLPASPAAEGGRSRTRRWLAAALASTLAASAWLAIADDDSGQVAAPRVARPPAALAARADTSPAAATAAPAWPDAPQPRRLADAPTNALAWSAAAPVAAPAPPVVAAAAAKPFVGPVLPQAPPFAYTLIGRLDDGEPRALLTGPLRSFDVRAGDILDKEWRVDAVTAEGLSVTWLPAGKRQQIGFKAS